MKRLLILVAALVMLTPLSAQALDRITAEQHWDSPTCGRGDQAGLVSVEVHANIRGQVALHAWNGLGVDRYKTAFVNNGDGSHSWIVWTPRNPDFVGSDIYGAGAATGGGSADILGLFFVCG
jgi:hypothetical protein